VPPPPDEDELCEIIERRSSRCFRPPDVFDSDSLAPTVRAGWCAAGCTKPRRNFPPAAGPQPSSAEHAGRAQRNNPATSNSSPSCGRGIETRLFTTPPPPRLSSPPLFSPFPSFLPPPSLQLAVLRIPPSLSAPLLVPSPASSRPPKVTLRLRLGLELSQLEWRLQITSRGRNTSTCHPALAVLELRVVLFCGTRDFGGQLGERRKISDTDIPMSLAMNPFLLTMAWATTCWLAPSPG